MLNIKSWVRPLRFMLFCLCATSFGVHANSCDPAALSLGWPVSGTPYETWQSLSGNGRF